MKRLLFLFGLFLSISCLNAQTAGILSQYLDQSKAEIKEQLSDLVLVRDWGKGKNMDMEEPDPIMLKFRFDDQNICTAVNIMSFEKMEKRIEEELYAILADSWEMEQKWITRDAINYRFKKGGKILRMSNNQDQVVDLGYLEAKVFWPPLPEN